MRPSSEPETVGAVLPELLLVVPELPELDFLGSMMVVTPAGLVFLLTFLVLGNLLSFLYFILRFWNQILI